MFSRALFRFTRSARVGVRRSLATIVSRPKLMTGLTVGTSALLASAFVVEAEPKVPLAGVPGTNKERTFIAIKPDGVQRGLVGEIIARFEKKGYKLVAMKLVTVTPAFAAEHYDDLKSKPFFKSLTEYFASGPVCAMVWEGPGVIKGGRRLLGETKPEDSLPGTIRGDLCVSIGRNICHGSDSAEGAAHEIPHWFKEAELSNWTPANEVWVLEKK